MSFKRAIAAAAALAAVALLPSGALAQAAAPAGDVNVGRQVWQSGANCRDCHGWAANGVQDVPQQPQGASLRATTLTPEQMAEVVRCGRPATEMPYFGGNVWTATNRCYGMTQAEAGAQMPPKGDTNLNPRQVDGLVAFIFAQFVGKGPVTRQECEATFGANSPRCQGL